MIVLFFFAIETDLKNVNVVNLFFFEVEMDKELKDAINVLKNNLLIRIELNNFD